MQTVYLVGGSADVYATEAAARLAVERHIRDAGEHVLGGENRSLVLFLLDQGCFDDALRVYNMVCPERWQWHVSAQEVRE